MTTTRQPEGGRWIPLTGTHRGFAVKGKRDSHGSLEEQSWGNVHDLFTLSGPVDMVDFVRAVRSAVRRQLAFRGRIALRGGKDVFATAEGPVLRLNTVRMGRNVDGALCDGSGHVHAELRRCAGQTFRLQTDPLTRVVLTEDADGLWRVLVVQDHTISDGWTIKLLASEIMREYERVSRDRNAEPLPDDESYFDWFDGPGQIDQKQAEAARRAWRAIMHTSGDLASRPLIPGGEWVATSDRLQDRQYVHRFSPDDDRRLADRAAQFRCSVADLLLASLQLAMMAISKVSAPISYIYSGRREPGAWRLMGLFCQEMLTVPLSPEEVETLDEWMARFLDHNVPRPDFGGLDVVDFQSSVDRFEEHTVAHFNFIPLRRAMQTDTGVRLDVATREEWEALLPPAPSNRFGIAVKVWNYADRPTEMTLAVDQRMCPWPEQAARAFIYGALEHCGSRITIGEALRTVYSHWIGAPGAERAVE